MLMQHKKIPALLGSRAGTYNRIFLFFYCLLDRGHFIIQETGAYGKFFDTLKYLRVWYPEVLFYLRSFTSMGVSMGLPNRSTNR